MKIIAFDLGANMAWASNRKKLIWGSAVYGGTRAQRLAMIQRLIPALLKDVDVVVYETPFARGRDATRSLWGIAGIIEACAENAGSAVLDVAVPTIKKFATGHGHAAKNEMIAAAQKFGYRGLNEHEADAVCLLKYAEANLEKVA